ELRCAHEKEQQKKNEQRVKENMQKARIEKLTKEEIKKQKEESKYHPTLDLDDERLESSHEDKYYKEGSYIEDDVSSTENTEDSFENLKDNQNLDDSEEIKDKKVHNKSNKMKNKQENEFEINKQLVAEHDEKIEKNTQKDKNILNIILSKIEKHWPIIAIVLAIILIFILVW